MKKNIFKIFAMLMVLAMLVAPASAMPVLDGRGPVEFTEELAVAHHPYPDGVDKAIKGVEGPARFIIQLEDAPLASYMGSIEGLKATSPAITGEGKLDVKAPASQAYLSFLAEKQVNTLRNIETAVSRDLNVAFQYKIGFNGFAIEMTPEEIETIAREVPGIVRIEREKIQELDTDVGPTFIGAPDVWSVGSEGSKGEGVVVGIIDGGINFDHPSFADVGPVDGYDHENPYGSEVYFGVCDPTNTDHYDPTYTCNDKLLGAYGYVETDPVYEKYSPEDSGGHGTHTASTVAGNVVNATMEKPTIDETQQISGVAPHANIIAYDVCYEDSGNGGCPGAAINAAIEQAIIDQVDVINFSISGGADPYNDSTEQLFLAAFNAGVFVSTSAGNNGPDPETTGHRSPWLMSTAASTHNRTYLNGLIDMTGGDTAPPADIIGKGFTSALAATDIVYAGDYGNALCKLEDEGGSWAPGTDFTGQIVVCDRGETARVNKAIAVAELNAAGFVLANDAANGNALVGDAYVIPGVHITFTDGAAVKAWLASGSGHQAAIQGATRDLDASNANIMADFSSRGPNGTIDVLKPDVTAPGVDIWAAVNSPVPGEGNPEYDFYSGTSMSSPHTAGAAALLVALHPEWTPAEIKSAMMLTAINPGILKEDASTPGDVFDFGAGLIQVDLALEAGLVMNETYNNFVAANPDDGGNPQTLNLASVYNSMCLSECTWTRTVENVLDVTTDWTVSVIEPTGVTINVSPMTFSLVPGATQVLTITANVDSATVGEWYFGDIRLTEDSSQAPDSHIPLAVTPSSGVVPEKLTIRTRRNAGSQLMTDLQAIEITEFSADYFGLAEGTIIEFDLAEDPTNTEIYDDLAQVHVEWVNVTANTVRMVAEIIETPSLDMDLFVGLDDGDGVPEEAEEVCRSATGAVFEYCDIMDPDSGQYWVLVQNWTSSAEGATDPIDLSIGLVTTDQNNMEVTGPTTVPQGDLFDARFYWDEPDMVEGDRWYGVFTLGSNASEPDNIGTIPVDLIRYADDVTKTADGIQAEPGDEITFTISIAPNVSGEDLIYTLSDILPEGLELVPGSVTGGASAVGDRIYWSGVMKGTSEYVITTSENDPLCDTGFGGYVDLEGFGILAQAGISGDTDYWTAFAGQDPINFFGVDYAGFGFTDDGFLIFDPANNYGGRPWTPQSLPDPDAPNNLAAILWQDMEIAYDGSINQGVSLANAGSSVSIVEFDDVYLYQEPTETFDFEAVVYSGVDDSPGAYEMVFAYDNLVGSMNEITIGLENANASEAYSLLNLGDGSSLLSDGFMVCVDYSGPTTPHVITYKAVVTGEVGDTIQNVVTHDVFAEGYQVATATLDIDVIDYGTLDLTMMSPYDAYEFAEFSVDIANPTTGGTYSNALLQYRLNDINLDQIVSFEVDDGGWVDVPMVQDGEDVVGYVGDMEGMAFAPDSSMTYNLRLVVRSATMHDFEWFWVDLDGTTAADYIASDSETIFFLGDSYLPLIFR